MAARLQHETRPVRPAAFLDRDGVLNIDQGYTYLPEDLVLTSTAIEGVLALNRAGYRVIVVTNQSGVARGLYTEVDVDRFHAHLQARLGQGGARIDAFYACPFHPDGTVPAYAREHEDRKPQPGMLLRAMRDWPTDLGASIMIGDRPSDMEAAGRAGVRGIMVEANRCDLAAIVRGVLAVPAGAGSA